MKQTYLSLSCGWFLLGLYFTFYFKFLNIRFFGRAIQVIRGKFDKPNDKGEVTHFQSFTAAMSGTIGLGNMQVLLLQFQSVGQVQCFDDCNSFFGMTLKFVEVSLGHKYRVIHKDGTVSGGAIRYLSTGLEEVVIKN